ncbi:PREDICTED: uncharacterized protein LOC106147667 [Chinchilla lanigera]|uniref:uncharacterized protein LOC106147667 n=1 Tax=Chinchilla lanigera TaxID=34839 RepID=UPI0006983274|nr:PREDICTED: uncharacterized protein LOC106147667 [Chinchilla lanigera]
MPSPSFRILCACLTVVAGRLKAAECETSSMLLPSRMNSFFCSSAWSHPNTADVLFHPRNFRFQQETQPGGCGSVESACLARMTPWIRSPCGAACSRGRRGAGTRASPEPQFPHLRDRGRRTVATSPGRRGRRPRGSAAGVCGPGPEGGALAWRTWRGFVPALRLGLGGARDGGSAPLAAAVGSPGPPAARLRFCTGLTWDANVSSAQGAYEERL